MNFSISTWKMHSISRFPRSMVMNDDIWKRLFSKLCLIQLFLCSMSQCIDIDVANFFYSKIRSFNRNVWEIIRYYRSNLSKLILKFYCIDKATSPLLLEPDWETILRLCDVIKSLEVTWEISISYVNHIELISCFQTSSCRSFNQEKISSW